MRFDLEIPAVTNTKLVYVSEGDEINTSLVPLSYYFINTKDMLISDFVTSENSFSTKEFLADGYEVKQGPSFDVSSDKLLITHIAKFLPKEGIRVPLFYKHIIYGNIGADVVRIFDYYNTELSKDEYVVETYNDKTYIYLNKTDNIQFIEYATGAGFNKSILDLTPVFQETTWESLALNGTISDFEYTIDGSTVRTTYLGDLFVSFINNIQLFREPTGNIDDPWYVGVLNSNFTVKTNGITYLYTTPEYYRQKFDGDGNIKQVDGKKCKKVYPDVIKSQYNIARSMYDSIYVHIKDFFTGKVKYALTTNSYYFDTEYVSGVYYAKLDNISYDGYILLPIKMEDNDVAYITHFTEDDYCQYPYFDVNTLTLGLNNYCGFYLVPNVTENDRGIYHALIGDSGDFSNYYEYIDFIKSNNYLHVALISTTGYFDNAFINIYDFRQQKEIIKNKYDVCKLDIDLLYSELINEGILLPTNDAVLAKIDTKRIVNEARFAINNDNSGLADNTSKTFLERIKVTLDRSLDASTKAIIEINTSV